MKDKKFGFGTYWYPDGTIYKGHWFKGLKNQSGRLFMPSGRVYETEYEHNKILKKTDVTGQLPHLHYSQGEWKKPQLDSRSNERVV